ncbi:hypothetical protein [Streptococcus mutans]|uniref:hypothetical protein n=1 Tax=Streptococcus mutans TaxID=1309 RepID=UPI001454F32A|nr:hypothetical protein [Streptococcus mutans]NLQ47924.1 hypothetical protein [Streptococcus mutans]
MNENELIKYSDIKEVFNNMGIDDKGFHNPTLSNDLELDSQEFIEFIVELESVLGLNIPDGILENKDTITDVLIKLNNLKFNFTNQRVDKISVNADVSAVRMAVWDLNSWEQKLEHIKSIKISNQTDDYQEFWMEVLNSHGDVSVTAKSTRFLYEDFIYFYQPTPPKYLSKHGGYWEFKQNGNTTEIILHHKWIVSDAAFELLECQNEIELQEKISKILQDHALETLLKWKGIFDEN